MGSAPLYTPLEGYGAQEGEWNYVQTSPSGGSWSTTPQTPSFSGGNVLGTTTPYTSSGTSNVESSRSAPDILREGAEGIDKGPSFDDMFNQIRKSYQPVIDNLTTRLSGLPGELEGMLSEIGTAVGSQEGILNRAQEAGEARLSGQETEAKGTEKKTLRALSEDVRNLFEAGNMKLGAMGASDSSAAEMLKFAIAKQGNKRTADVVGQTRQILAQIDGLRTQLQRETQDKLAGVQQWKFQQETQARRYISGLRNQLLDAQGNVNAAIGAREIDTIAGAYERTRNMMDQLQMASIQMEAQIADEYRQREANLNDFASQLAITNRYQGNYATNYNQLYGLNETPASKNVVPTYAPQTTGVGTDEDKKQTLNSILSNSA